MGVDGIGGALDALKVKLKPCGLSRFGDYLRTHEVQVRALQLGFRPTDPTLGLRDYDLGPNPFTSLRRYGVELDPDLREPPRLDGASVATLIELWGDATGR